jgi:hypothetical protein
MGNLLETTHSAIKLQFVSSHTAETWTLVTVYGPCRGVMRDEFVQWLHDLDIPIHDNWLLIGDFNFMRSVDNRNKPGADMADIFLFNNIISHLGLLELPLKGRRFTWSNMQATPLMEQLDWFFTTCEWTLRFPNTMVFPLSKSTSDHTPCVVSISTSIPKAKIFRFENIWLEQPGFMDVVRKAWDLPTNKQNVASILAAKFKNLRYALKKWGKNLSHLKLLIEQCNKVILFFDNLEDSRNLSREEFNFRNIVKVHLKKLLGIQSAYWKNRCTIRWIQLGGENTKFFHAKATERYRYNVISVIKDEQGNSMVNHNQKANAFWACYKNRMGVTNDNATQADISHLINPVEGLDILSQEFSTEEIEGVVKHMKTDRAPGPD